jgi:hypothetical protein
MKKKQPKNHRKKSFRQYQTCPHLQIRHEFVSSGRGKKRNQLMVTVTRLIQKNQAPTPTTTEEEY